jgi:hypothetical protein
MYINRDAFSEATASTDSNNDDKNITDSSLVLMLPPGITNSTQLKNGISINSASTSTASSSQIPAFKVASTVTLPTTVIAADDGDKPIHIVIPSSDNKGINHTTDDNDKITTNSNKPPKPAGPPPKSAFKKLIV